MAREYKKSQIKKLIFEHNRLLKLLKGINDLDLSLKDAVRDSATKYAEKLSIDATKEIYVDELLKAEKGIRVKLLKDNNINTIYDVLEAGRPRITAINGIGADGSKLIYSIAKDYANKIKLGTRIRLSYDGKCEESENLVIAISKYLAAKGAGNMAHLLLQKYEYELGQAIRGVEPLTKGLSWLFTPKVVKNKALDEALYLEEMLESDYGTHAREIEEKLQRLDRINAAYAWNEFSKEAVNFNGAIEELMPGLLGVNDDSYYGLPKDLAEEIIKVDLDLEGFKASLRGYQEMGVKYIVSQKRVLLGDEMGLGKTIQSIASMVHLRNKGCTKFLVVCPAAVLSNWEREIEKFSDLTVYRIHGKKSLPLIDTWKRCGGVCVTTFESTKSFEMDEDFLFDYLIVDEAHYIKNKKIKRTADTLYIAAHTKRLLFLTGTALENKVEEMLVLLNYLNVRLAREATKLAFMSSAEQFREVIAPIYYRRKREDVLHELPEKIEKEAWLSLTPSEESAYKNALSTRSFMSARRVSWNIDDLSKSTKAQRLKEIVDEAKEDGRKILVFSYFLDTITKIKEYLGVKLDVINGSVDPEKRQRIIDEFDKAEAGSVLLAQIGAGGTGLNIQSASVVILCEPQLKPSIENQAVARAHRMGQSRTVLVYRLLCERTVDEGIMKRLIIKQREFDTYADKSSASEQITLTEHQISEIMDEELKRFEN